MNVVIIICTHFYDKKKKLKITLHNNTRAGQLLPYYAMFEIKTINYTTI